MKTRFIFALSAMLIIAIATAGTFAFMRNLNSAASKVQSATSNLVAAPAAEEPLTVTTKLVHTRVESARLWSGQVFLSDNNAPDSELNTNLSACVSEEQNHRYGGCIE
jgi:hypothetical protein